MSGLAMTQSTSGMTAALPRWRRSAFSAFIERHFKWLHRPAGGPADPGAFDLSAAVLALGQFRQLRFRDSRPCLRRAEEFHHRHRRSQCAIGAAADHHPVGGECGDRVPARPRAGARHGEAIPRPRAGHGDPDHSAVHQPGDRRPVLGALPAATLRPGRLYPHPIAGPAGGDQLADPKPLVLHRHRHRRCLAVDALHVRHPARRAGGHTRPSLRGGGARRGLDDSRPSSM